MARLVVENGQQNYTTCYGEIGLFAQHIIDTILGSILRDTPILMKLEIPVWMRHFGSGSNNHEYLWSRKYPLEELSIQLPSSICELGKFILLKGTMFVELQVAITEPFSYKNDQNLFHYMSFLIPKP